MSENSPEFSEQGQLTRSLIRRLSRFVPETDDVFVLLVRELKYVHDAPGRDSTLNFSAYGIDTFTSAHGFHVD